MHINEKQEKIIIAGAIVIIIMGVFPPWGGIFPYTENITAGPYSFVFAPPPEIPNFGARIDIPRLLVQWIVVVLATALAVFFYRDKPMKK